MGFISKIFLKVKQQKSLANYLSSSMISIPVSLITSFISLRNIEVERMGTWTAVSIFQGYAIFLGLGIVNGMNRELPHALGQNDRNAAESYASSAMFYVLLLAGVYFLLGSAFVTFFVDSYIVVISVMAMVLKLSTLAFSQYLEGTFRSNSEFDKLSKATWISSGSRLLTSPLIFLGYEGFLLYMVLFDFVKAALLYLWRPIRVKPKYESEILLKLIKVGMPIFIATYLAGLIDTIPRLYILEDGGERALGIFAPVMMLLGIFEQFGAALSSFIYPKLTFRYGKGEKLKTLYFDNIKMILGASLLMSVLIVPMFFALNYFVELFPKYRESEPYLKTALLVGPLITYNLTGVIFVVAKRYISLYIMQAFKAIFFITVIFVIRKLGFADAIFASLWGIISTYLFLALIGGGLGWLIVRDKNRLAINKK